MVLQQVNQVVALRSFSSLQVKKSSDLRVAFSSWLIWRPLMVKLFLQILKRHSQLAEDRLSQQIFQAADVNEKV